MQASVLQGKNLWLAVQTHVNPVQLANIRPIEDLKVAQVPCCYLSTPGGGSVADCQQCPRPSTNAVPGSASIDNCRYDVGFGFDASSSLASCALQENIRILSLIRVLAVSRFFKLFSRYCHCKLQLHSWLSWCYCRRAIYLCWCQAGTYENSGSCASCVQYQTSQQIARLQATVSVISGILVMDKMTQMHVPHARPARTRTRPAATRARPAPQSPRPSGATPSRRARQCRVHGLTADFAQRARQKIQGGVRGCAACPRFSSPQASVAVDACGCVDSYYTDSGADTCEECTNGLTFDDGLVLWWRFENSAHLNFDSITGENIGTSAGSFRADGSEAWSKSIRRLWESIVHAFGVDDINIRGQQHSMTFLPPYFQSGR